jgi:stage IV sporulation protein FB
MAFYINRVRIEIEYSFLLIIAFSLMVKNESILFVILFSSLHELGHLTALLFFKVKPERLIVSFYGIGLKYKYNLSFYQDLVFLLSGALVNLILYLLGFKKEINLALAAINLLPLYPLDGGRALKLILNKAFLLDVSDRIFQFITLVFIVSFSVYAFVLKNVSLALIIVYIIIFSLNNTFD